ncbi:UDP-N-acetylmuramate--L-alanine ligase [Chloroflexia bacterium SDU3-3]|nr:UDP-N-acetylmuramate--L-alanine ligase [Chloroflexia bacterium SDU3-3]
MAHYHIIGIAGAGMSAIANVLLDQGHAVSGSDPQQNALTAALAARGATVHQGHDPAFVRGADVVLTTSAARPDHVELAAARAAGIPVQKRADLWREWSAQRDVIAVAGTHGKTTTTALLSLILLKDGRDPGFVVGADVPALGTNARWGDPAAPLVLEADEYDRTFLALTPALAVVTNVEWDHVDIYPTQAEYDEAFRTFASAVPDRRRVIACGDDEGALRAVGGEGTTLYGIDEALGSDPVSCRRALLDWSATAVRADAEGTSFDVWRYDQRTFATRSLGRFLLGLYGQHNVRNAMGALAAAVALGVGPQAIAEGLAAYHGADRRFEHKGAAGGVDVVDDYAHHPSEVRATLQAARSRFPGRRLVVYLQPHTYSRTAALLDDWADAFGDADVLRVGDIYAAREQNTLGVSSEQLVARIHHPDVAAAGSVAQAAEAIAALLRPGDVLLTLGAGDGHAVGSLILARRAGQL